METSTIVINIGRSVGGQPMNNARWDRFKRELMADLEQAQADILFRGDGDGIWAGRIEETAHSVTAIMPTANIDNLWDRLALLAYLYDQDAIALIAADGDANLIMAADPDMLYTDEDKRIA